VSALRAPFPYFGGKRRAASLVWEALGNVDHYVEPFCGSAAVLLARPHVGRCETINDRDGMVANFWRAVRSQPDAVAAVRVLCPATETDTSAHVGVSDRGFGPTICPSGDTDGTETPFRYSSSERGFGPIEHSSGDTQHDDAPLPSPSRRTVAEEHDGAGWAWLRVDSQRWDS